MVSPDSAKKWKTLSQVSQWSYSGAINPFLAAPPIPAPQGSDLEGTMSKTYFLESMSRERGMARDENDPEQSGGVSDHNGSCRV